MWNSPRWHIHILAKCSRIYHPCYRQGLTRDPVCVPGTLSKMQMQQLKLKSGLHTADEGGFVCICVPPPLGLTHHKTGNSTILLERQYMEKVAWLQFSHECSLSTLCLCRPELSYIRKKCYTGVQGIQGQLKWRELSVSYTKTPTHIHISGITSNLHTCRNVLHKYTPPYRTIFRDDSEGRRERYSKLIKRVSCEGDKNDSPLRR